MPHDRLDNLQIGFSFTKSCTKSVSQIVCRKVGEQHWLSMLFSCFYFFRRIVGRRYPLDCPIDWLCIHYISITVTENKSCHSINLCIRPAFLFLFFPDHFKSIFYRIQHRNRPHPSFCFRCWNVIFWGTILTYRIIRQIMINADNPLLIIDVFPSQSQHFTDTTASSKKNGKDWPPVIINRMRGNIFNKCSLLWNCQCMSHTGFHTQIFL